MHRPIKRAAHLPVPNAPDMLPATRRLCQLRRCWNVGSSQQRQQSRNLSIGSNGNGVTSQLEVLPVHSPKIDWEDAYVQIAPPPTDMAGWTDEVWARGVDIRRQIFCNRSLNMKQIKAVGFDMDYTLAQYKPETFEQLAYEQTVDKLVTVLGYPKELYSFTFDDKYMCRGLVMDKRYGNVLKVDRHKYVKVGYHGFRKLTAEERSTMYHAASVRDPFAPDSPDFAMIDTLFSLAEAYLYMQLVELKDARPDLLPASKTYHELYKDVRGAVDLCHRDGSIKREVANNPAKYIHPDPLLPSLLNMLRQSGRKLFVATNSLWDYSNVVMNYVLEDKVGADKNDEWLRYFDVVIVGSAKPAFFTSKQPLFAVETKTGKLLNTDNGAPVIPIDEKDIPAAMGNTGPQLGQGSRVFQGGTYTDLHGMLGVRSGADVLYVGDHIYGDIVKSKKSLGWRTMLVIPELESELAKTEQATYDELKRMRTTRDQLDDQIQKSEWFLRHGHIPAEAVQQNEQLLNSLRQQRDQIKKDHSQVLQELHERVHKVWGLVTKTGHQNSWYAHQVERFACVYTSHVSNMALFSPDKSYVARMDGMAHEDWAEAAQAPLAAISMMGPLQ